MEPKSAGPASPFRRPTEGTPSLVRLRTRALPPPPTRLRTGAMRVVLGGGTELFIGKNRGNNCLGVQDSQWIPCLVSEDGGGTTVFDGSFHSIIYSQVRLSAGLGA